MNLTIDTVSNTDDDQRNQCDTPNGFRGSRDLRSPGQPESPDGAEARQHQLQLRNGYNSVSSSVRGSPPPSLVIPDFITQTDANGNATTPRSAQAIDVARSSNQSITAKIHPSAAGGHSIKSDEFTDKEIGTIKVDGGKDFMAETCETIVGSIKFMCCCLVNQSEIDCDNDQAKNEKHTSGKDAQYSVDNNYATEKNSTTTASGLINNGGDQHNKLLGPIKPEDTGKKCLVLDLDETLVHSSFRAVNGADFVIPVQIEDVVHFVYVMKRPGVDEFLIEMAKHYEIVIYTASLNKYADPLLDLLDPQKVIRYRLFRESCVFYEGNFVKDLSVLDRDLSSTIIIDNSPNSYLFHPENAIDCSSFIDDPQDRELDQIGSFLTGIKNVSDVRGICHQWKDWPVVNIEQEDNQHQ